MEQTKQPAPQAIYMMGGILGAMFLIERVTKSLAFKYISPDTPLWGSKSFGLIFQENTGIAFSLPVPGWLLAVGIVLIVFFSVALYLHFYRRLEFSGMWASGLLLIGTLSNAFDRLQYGFVIDFIRVTRLQTFNIADVFVLCGVSILVIVYFRKEPA